MNQKLIELREQRLQKLFADCRQHVIAQIIGPFGLSTAMFDDRNGGNVTTLHNFATQDESYMATDGDKALQANSRKAYNAEVRAEYLIDTSDKAQSAGGKTWKEKRDEKIKAGVDEYTGASVAEDGTITLNDGRVVRAELDHIVSLSEIHSDPKLHLALGKATTDQTGQTTVDISRMREVANHDDCIALTNQPLNGSKSDTDLKEWAEMQRSDSTSNAENFGVNKAAVMEKYNKAKERIASEANWALFEKQSTELLATGGKQAAAMGLRQALGILLTELVNGLFNEVKALIRQGAEASKSLFEDIRQRLARVVSAVVAKIPDAVSQMFDGSVSGFISNLLTFLLNNFLSTAKRFVTVIREGLLGLYKAFKLIFFPPEHMSTDEALQAGLTLLATVITSSLGILLTETVNTFMATVPFLKPVADLVTPVLMGILTGLLSAFITYKIDCAFDRHRHASNEQLMDALMSDAQARDAFAAELTALTESALSNVENYAKSISLYRDIGLTLGAASVTSAATLASLAQTVTETREQVNRCHGMIEYINGSQAEIEGFINTL